jgi:hypothetical protein
MPSGASLVSKFQFVADIPRFVADPTLHMAPIQHFHGTVATMQQSINSGTLSRRHMLLGGMALAALPAMARASGPIIRVESINPMLLERARAAMVQHGALIRNPDRLALVDFSKASREARLSIMHLPSGQGMQMLVAHGRGSDPDHSGWLNWFSNEPGSLASSRGAYLTGVRYVGVHGDAQRLIGLEPDNNNADPRAVVIHGADYVSEDLILSQGKLGRSEGCFALRRDDISMALSLLGEGTLLFADRV